MNESEMHQEAIEKIKSIPVVSALGIEILELDSEQVTVKAPHDKRYDGVFDTFHGGMLMTIADTISCFLIIYNNGPDTLMATTDMNIRFLAPCVSDVTARARYIKKGKTLNPIEIEIWDAEGVRVAVAQVTYIILGKKK
jgi:uncharacterized protein (TIGR00369 family)